PAEHVVAAPELPGALDRDDVLRLLDDADDVERAPRVAADPALLALGAVVAGHAEADLRLHPLQRGDQPADVGRLGGQQVEGDALRALGTDAGQTPELVDEVLDSALVHGAPTAGRGTCPADGAQAGQTQPATEAAGQRAHGAGGEVVDAALGVPDRGDDEVLQGLDVLGVHRGGG